MGYNRRKLICRGCGKQRVIVDDEHKLCAECAIALQEGRLTPEAFVKPRRAGRPQVIVTPKTPETPETPETPDTPDTPETPTPKARATGAAYYCDACNSPVRYAQQKCKCGVFIDWRGSTLETDPEIVICPHCGAVCGYVGSVSHCPHCNYGA